MSKFSRLGIVAGLMILSVWATLRGRPAPLDLVNPNPDNTQPIAALLPDWQPAPGDPPAQIVLTSRRAEPRGSHSLDFVLLNSGSSPLYFSGYRPDSYQGGMPVGQIGPLYTQERKVGGAWQKVFIGWCGTGEERRRLLPGQAGRFRVFQDPNEFPLRIGVPCLRSESAPYRDAEIVWSKALSLPPQGEDEPAPSTAIERRTTR